MTTDSFSFSRTERLLTAFVSEHRRQLLLQSALVVVLMVIVAVIACIGCDGPGWRQRDEAFGTLTVVYYLQMVILSAVSASLISTGLGSKAGRITTLMRPGHAGEKFAARWVVYVAGFFVVFVVAMTIAEGVRMALMKVFYPDAVVWSVVGSLFNGRMKEELFATSTTPFGLILCAFIAPLLANQSFYVLGAMVWPRQSFIKTTVATYVLTFVYGIAASVTAMLAMPHTQLYSRFHPSDSPTVFVTLWIALCVVITAINSIVAWRRLAETDIISTKI